MCLNPITEKRLSFIQYFFSLLLSVVFLCSRSPAYAATKTVQCYTLREVLASLDMPPSAFSEINIVQTQGSARSPCSAIVLSSPAARNADGKCAYILDENVRVISPVASPARGAGTDNSLFYLNNAGVAVAGYCHYETISRLFTGNYTAFFFRPCRAEAKRTALESGACLTVSTLHTVYSSTGMAYDYSNFANDPGDKTHTATAQNTSVTKGYRIGSTSYPSGYALDYIDTRNDGSTLTVTILLSGTSTSSIGVEPNAQSSA